MTKEITLEDLIPITLDELFKKLERLVCFYQGKTEDDIKEACQNKAHPKCPTTIYLLTYMDYIYSIQTNKKYLDLPEESLKDLAKIYNILNHWLEITRKYLWDQEGYMRLGEEIVSLECRSYISDRQTCRKSVDSAWAAKLLKDWIQYFLYEVSHFTIVDPEVLLQTIDRQYNFRPLMSFHTLVEQVKREHEEKGV